MTTSFTVLKILVRTEIQMWLIYNYKLKKTTKKKMNTSEKVGFNLSSYSVGDEYLRLDLQSNNINKFSTILHSSANLIFY